MSKARDRQDPYVSLKDAEDLAQQIRSGGFRKLRAPTPSIEYPPTGPLPKGALPPDPPLDETPFGPKHQEERRSTEKPDVAHYLRRKLSEAEKDELAAYSGQPLDPEERKKRNLIARAKAVVKSRVLKARADPNEFMEYAFKDEHGKPLRQAHIHREFQETMASGVDSVNEYPRDHGKTTQKEGHALWRLGNNPELRIKIVCASDSKAVERLFAIIQHIRQNPRIQDVFPHLRPAKLGDWTKHKIVVERSGITRDASIEALGVLSTATGGRCDLLFADDVVDRRNALELPKLRETVKSAWDSDWSNLMEPQGQIVYTGTPWHTADLTHKLAKNRAYRLVRRAVGEPGNPYAPIWEAKWPEVELRRRREKIGQLEYDRGFRLVALSGDFVTVKEDWISYWDSPPDLGKLQVFSAFDISSGKAADYFANVVVGLDPQTLTMYVLEAWHSKLTFLQRAEAIVQQTRRWQPQATGVEEESMKSLTQYLDQTTTLNIMPLRPSLSKQVRLMSVTPLLERGQIKFNPALCPERMHNPDEHGDVIGELTEFPLGANDDLVDAFVHAVSMTQALGGEDDEGVDVAFSILGTNDEPRGSGLLDFEEDHE